MKNRSFLKDYENGEYLCEDAIPLLVPYLYEGIPYALHYQAEPELRKNVMAAIIKHKEPDIDFEEILEQLESAHVADDSSFSSDTSKHLVINTAFTASKLLLNYYHWTEGEKTVSQTLFVASMTRLSFTFNAAIVLLNCGYYTEIVPTLRMIYEQLSWGCFLLKETNEEKIKNSSPQSTVTYLKEELGKEYGKLYGDLSGESHLTAKFIGKYMEQREKGIAITGRSGKKSAAEMRRIVILLQAYGDVIWKGIQHFGIPESDIGYYKEWHEAHCAAVIGVRGILNKKYHVKRNDE